MVVTVRYFAVLREQRGVASETIEVEPGTTLDALYERLFPASAAAKLPVSFMRNRISTKGRETLAEGDEIGMLPPIGGG